MTPRLVLVWSCSESDVAGQDLPTDHVTAPFFIDVSKPFYPQHILMLIEPLMGKDSSALEPVELALMPLNIAILQAKVSKASLVRTHAFGCCHACSSTSQVVRTLSSMEHRA